MQILHKLIGSVLLEIKGDNLYGADLRGADLRGADLYETNLRGADLYGADLRGADLYGANLYGAKLEKSNIIVLLGFEYDVIITDKHMKIGCQVHLHGEWKKFTVKTFPDTNKGRWKLWRESRTMLLALCARQAKKEI